MRDRKYTLANGETFTVQGPVLGSNNGGGTLNIMVQTPDGVREVVIDDIVTITTKGPRPLNGYRLVAAIPETRGDGTVRGFYAVVERDDVAGGEYVTGWVWSLGDHEWSHGYYTSDFAKALANAIGRAGWGDVELVPAG